MGRARGAKQFFNFVKGWNTEASPMTFPEGAAKDLDNVILDIDGSIRRRPGVDFEENPTGFGETLTATQTQERAFSLHVWEDVAGTDSSAFFVSQVGTTLYVHRQGGSASQNLVGTVSMSPFVINSAEAPKTPILTTNGSGVLFVTGKYFSPFYVEWDGSSLTATAITTEIRDFVGVDDGLRISERPTGNPTYSHVYNLMNQGWDITRINDYAGTTIVAGTEEVSVSVDTGKTAELPSNADIVYLGMKTNNDGDLVFEKSELKAQTFGNTRAPQGHFKLNLFSQNRANSSGLVGVPTSTSLTTRFTTTAFHNGRVFFSGISDNGYFNKVYFSQQLTELENAGKFYQEQDPTAEEFNDLLDTDGGEITIPDSGKILRLIEGPRGIIALSTNGAWQIASPESAFKPTDVSITKVSDIGCSGAETVVNADGIILYWSTSGIVALTPSEITGVLSAEIISKNTIQTGYLLIGGLQQKFARGAYIEAEKKVVWLYSTDSAFDGVTDRFKYNGVLIFDLNLGAFYKYSISDLDSNTPFVCGIANQQPFVSTTTSEVVTVT